MAARKVKTEEEKRRELQIAAQNRARKDAAREALQSNITNAPLFQATQKITESQPKYQQAAKKVEQKTGVKPTRVSSGSKSSGSSGSRSSGSSRSTGIPKNLRADTYDATMNRIQTAARTRANRLKELDTLTNNSVAWHFADAAGKEALRKANDAIRARYGLLFDEATGMTSTPEGENLSVEVPKIVEKERSYNEQTPLSVLGHNLGAGLAGINRGFYSTLDFLLPDFMTPNAVQEYINKAKTNAEDVQEKVREYNYSRGGTVGGVAGDLLQSAVGAVPQVVIALMSGGTSAAGQLAGASDDVVSAITRQLSNNSGYMSSFLSTVGTDYERAKANGASDTEAALSAILSSAATAGIETAGGIDVPAQSTSRIRNAARTVLEEGGEEVLQGVAQNTVQAFTDPSIGVSDILNPAEMAQNFAGGALLGGPVGLGRRPVNAPVRTETQTNTTSRAQTTVNTPQQNIAPDTINIGDTQVERGAGQITSPTAALTNDPLRVNAENIGFTPLNLESTLSRLNPMSTAATQAMRNVQQVYPTQRVQPTLQTAQPQRIQPTLQGTPSMNALRQAISPESSVGAAQSNFDPYTHMANEYGTIEPGENPARIVDVPKSTDGTDRVNAGARTFMEAAVTTDEVVELLEQEVASGNMSHDVIPDKPTMERAARRVTNTADLNAAVDDWTAQFVEGGQAPGKEDVAYGQALFAYFNKTGDNENAIKMASSLISQATRAGQVLQAQKMLKKLSPEGRVMSAVKIKQNIQNQLNEQYGDNAPQVELNDELLDNLRTADNVDKAMKDIIQDIANQVPNTWMDKWNAWRYTSMLANIRTHVRNILGNTVFRPAIATKNKVGAVLETAADKTLRTFGKEGIERTKSITTNKADREFAKSEFEKLQSELEGSRYEQTSQDSLKRLKTNPFSGGVLERIGIGNFNLANGLNRLSNLNSGALDWEDTVAKKSVYVQSMAEYMKANGLTAKDMYNDLGGETDALLSAREYAKNEALKATFQDANALADLLTSMERKLGKPGQFIVGGLVPFKRTPANIIKRGVEYSPLGVLNGARKLFSKSSTIPEALDSIAAGLTGTGVLALGYALAERGWISGGDDENDKKQYFDEMQGKQSYAINFTWGDKEYSYTIDWAAPMALPLFVGVELNKFLKDDHPSIEDFTSALSRITEPVFDLTMMQGINDAISAAGYGNGAAATALAFSALTDYVTQGLAPTALGQVNRTFFDTTRRQTYPDPENNIPDSIEKVMQRTMQKIPGLSQRLTPYLDNFGREQQNGGFFENFLSPGYLEEITSTDAEKALDALYEATGDAAVLPTRPKKSYTIDGVEHNLTADQWLRLSNAKGQTALNAITALTQSGAYQSMSDQEKVNAVKDVYDYASAVAANQVYNKALEGTIKTVHDSGIDPGLYYSYKEMEDTLNETYEGYEARDQVFQTIRQDTSLTDYQKNQLYHTLLIQGTSPERWEDYQNISDVVTAEEFTDALIQYQAIKAYGDELEDGRAEAEATEFSYYLDSMGYDDAKRSALEDTFKYYKMFPADPTSYTFDMMRENGSQAERNNVDAIEASGVSAAQYMAIKTLTKGAKWTEGEKGAKLAAYAKIVSENSENYDQYAAIMHAMDFKNIEDVYTGAGSLPDVAAATSQVSRSANPTEEVGVNPVAAGPGVRLGSEYGYRKAPTEGASTFHEGNDIPAPMGTPVVAYKSGTVSFVGDSGSGGNMVQIDHPDGTKSVYLHLQDGSFQVSPGQTVSQGQQIANVGGTGISTGPHLDFRIMVNGKYVDPQSYYPGY